MFWISVNLEYINKILEYKIFGHFILFTNLNIQNVEQEGILNIVFYPIYWMQYFQLNLRNEYFFYMAWVRKRQTEHQKLFLSLS